MLPAVHFQGIALTYVVAIEYDLKILAQTAVHARSDDGHLVPVAIELWTPDEGSEDGPMRVFTPLNTDKQASSGS